MKAIGPFLALVGLCTAACGSSDDEQPTAAGDTLTFDASPPTRSEIGVVRWTMRANDPSAPLEGYDASGHATVEFDASEEIENGQRIDTFVLKQGGGSARVVVAIDGTGVKVLESSVEERDARVAALLAKDLQSPPQSAEGNSAGGRSGSLLSASFGEVSPQTLRPQDTLVWDVCNKLIKTCDGFQTDLDTGHAQITAYCPPDTVRSRCKNEIFFQHLYPNFESCKSAYDGACVSAGKLVFDSTKAQIDQRCVDKDGKPTKDATDCRGLIPPKRSN
jgi:hypothetical protein